MQSPESLRVAALDALGAHADARAVDLMERARITIVPSVREWTASSGKVTAHVVRLEVDARVLASLRASPGLHDTIVASVAAAMAIDPAHALHELEVYWGFESAGPGRGYREGADHVLERTDPQALPLAVRAYLEARGSKAIADAMRDADYAVERGRTKVTVSIRVTSEATAMFDRDRRARDLLEETVQTLMREPSGPKVKVVRR